jgi:hypothetical protein
LRTLFDYFAPLKPASANTLWSTLSSVAGTPTTSVRALLLAGSDKDAIKFWDSLGIEPAAASTKK